MKFCNISYQILCSLSMSIIKGKCKWNLKKKNDIRILNKEAKRGKSQSLQESGEMKATWKIKGQQHGRSSKWDRNRGSGSKHKQELDQQKERTKAPTRVRRRRERWSESGTCSRGCPWRWPSVPGAAPGRAEGSRKRARSTHGWPPGGNGHRHMIGCKEASWPSIGQVFELPIGQAIDLTSQVHKHKQMNAC